MLLCDRLALPCTLVGTVETVSARGVHLNSNELSNDVGARVLVVDDDELIATALARVLRPQYRVEVVHNALGALSCIADRAPDAMLCDIGLPDFDGLQLLGIVREVDPELPVILITGDPRLDTAIGAVEHGAIDYLVKPVEPAALLASVRRALALKQLAQTRLESTLVRSNGDGTANLTLSFERALDQLFVVYQPIVDRAARRVVGYESLVRTAEPSFRSPPELFAAAEQLDRIQDLGRLIRRAAVEPFRSVPSEVRLFVNLHPRDLLDDDLYDAETAFGSLAHRIVLEMTERASLDTIPDLRPRISMLRRLGYQMAIDDIGAGYSGLTSFAHVEPEVVKLDMSLVRGIEQAPVKQRVVRSLINLCVDLGVTTVAEGVVTQAEVAVLAALGCHWYQGYYFAKPGRPFPEVSWG